MASVRCCSMVTPITVAIFGGCAKLPSSALQEPAVQKVTGKQVWGGNKTYFYVASDSSVVRILGSHDFLKYCLGKTV